MGDLLPGAPTEDEDFNKALNQQALLDLRRLFAVPHDAEEAVNPLGNNVWAKQCYAFVHMCLYGEHGRFTKPFATFLQKAARGHVTEAMFTECFGMSYKQMLEQIRSYCDFTVYDKKGVRAKKGAPDLIKVPADMELRPATPCEIGRIKGEAFDLAGNVPAARLEFAAGYVRGDREAAFLAAFGLFERRQGQKERARKLLEAAYATKAARQDASIELARLRYEDACLVSEPEKKLSTPQVKAIVEPLLRAESQMPSSFEVYELMSDVLARSAERPPREYAVAAIRGAVRFPARLKLVYQCITLAAEIGDLKGAHTLAEHGIRNARDERSRELFIAAKGKLPTM
jgi:hypothetical protein